MNLEIDYFFLRNKSSNHFTLDKFESFLHRAKSAVLPNNYFLKGLKMVVRKIVFRNKSLDLVEY